MRSRAPLRLARLRAVIIAVAPEREQQHVEVGPVARPEILAYAVEHLREGPPPAVVAEVRGAERRLEPQGRSAKVPRMRQLCDHREPHARHGLRRLHLP